LELVLKEEIKEKFTEALVSGDYKQTTGQLRDDCGFCALGVLCDLFIKENKEYKWKRLSHDYSPEEKTIGHGFGVLPKVVGDWAGVNTLDVTFEEEHDGELSDSSIMDRNDEGDDFLDIANIVEERWREL